MPSFAQVVIHSSQFPEQVQRDLTRSFQTRRLNHKFLYDSFKQTQKWLALHEAWSPARRDPGCLAIYEQLFESTAANVSGQTVHIIGLGCGGGQKDAQLIRAVTAKAEKIFYTPCDVSTAMVLVARTTALELVKAEHCVPVVCDLATAPDLAGLIDHLSPSCPGKPVRIITCFGLLPNFEPDILFSLLSKLATGGEWLLLSANLASGPDYERAVAQILPQYDNELTRDWLMTILTDHGVEPPDGQLRFVIEDSPGGATLKRVAAYFHFLHTRSFKVGEERFGFHPGDSIRLFFSYRHTPALVISSLAAYGLEVLAHWISPSEEEGVFLCRRKN